MLGWSPYNYCFANPLKFVDSTGREPGFPGGGSNSFNPGAYIQTEFNSMWETGKNITYNFTYNTLPSILDKVSIPATAIYPPLGVGMALASDALKIEKDLFETGALSTATIVNTAIDAIPIPTTPKGTNLLIAISFTKSVINEASVSTANSSNDNKEQKKRDKTTIRSLNILKEKLKPINTHK